MNTTICDGALKRFEHSHVDLVDEIRLMAEAGAETTQAAPTREVRRPSLLVRLLARTALTDRAA